MSQAPSMPVFPDALIADTTHLSTEEFGAYCLLLFATWRNNGQPFPDDDKRLARICRVGPKKWARLRPTLVKFFDISSSFWRQKRLEKEWDVVQLNIAQKSKAGKASALKRNETQSTAVHTARPTEAQRNGNTQPQPHLLIEEPPIVPRKRGRKNGFDEPDGFAEWYQGYPHKIARSDAALAYRRALARASPEELLAGRDRYVASKPLDISWKHPATWLNKGCWLDEPATNGHANGHAPETGFLITEQEAEEIKWRGLIGRWVEKGATPADWWYDANPPGTPGCGAPATVLAEFGLGNGGP